MSTLIKQKNHSSLLVNSILPERNIIPGTAAGTVRRKAITVASAICSIEYVFEQFLPGVTIFGLRSVPSR
jgi:hypothetical protein